MNPRGGNDGGAYHHPPGLTPIQMSFQAGSLGPAGGLGPGGLGPGGLGPGGLGPGGNIPPSMNPQQQVVYQNAMAQAYKNMAAVYMQQQQRQHLQQQQHQLHLQLQQQNYVQGQAYLGRDERETVVIHESLELREDYDGSEMVEDLRDEYDERDYQEDIIEDLDVREDTTSRSSRDNERDSRDNNGRDSNSNSNSRGSRENRPDRRDDDRRPARDSPRNDRERRDRERDRRRDSDRDGSHRDDRRQGDRDRDRDRGHDRSRSRDRSSGRDRDRDRGDRKSDRRRSRSRDRDRDDNREDRGHPTSEIPTNTIMLRHLSMDTTDEDLRQEVYKCPDSHVKEVRLVKNKMTGTSRGFAFVEFENVNDAVRWMERYKGRFRFMGSDVLMIYSTPRMNEPVTVRNDPFKTDWLCSRCNANNFRRRDYCFKCNQSREVSEKTLNMEDGSEHVGTNPCNTILLRGLDALTTEDTITNILSEVASIPLKNVKVVREEHTKISKGYGFVELHSLRDAQEVLSVVTRRSAPLDIDGKAIIVTYCKNTFSTTLATMNKINTSADRSSYSHSSQEPYKQSSAKLYGRDGSHRSSQASSVAQNAIAAAAQQNLNHSGAAAKAISASRVAKVAHDQAQWSSNHDYSNPQNTEQYQYPVPDVSTYQYDQTSGYYFDPTTGLYYDPNTTYYWNQETQLFMYWDHNNSTYQVAPNQAEITAAAAGHTPPPQDSQTDLNDPKDPSTKKEKDKKEKVKMAKKIAKDMEKWAKSMNKTKTKTGTTIAQPQPILSEPIYTEAVTRPSAADAGYAMFGFKKDESMMPPPNLSKSAPAADPPGGLVASYGGDSDSAGEEDVEPAPPDLDKLIDWSKLACLLCKRQFPNQDVLSKHIDKSDLHKANVDEFLLKHQATVNANKQYRDRAKERRNKVGSTAYLGPKRR